MKTAAYSLNGSSSSAFSGHASMLAGACAARAGYLRHLAAFLSRSDRSPRLAFAGDYLIGPYTEAALTSGLRAADEVNGLIGCENAQNAQEVF